ncbi:E3 ubiquitin-protein ligase smurf2 [Dermatophagoides pteronyssinus]|uniref:HECT-type E3 ubiquitin transferase n=1 Tax=Dermatophagoides pteronyssinus TaxID=6956 RepID=A0ABQ8JB50_DERPT|nr:E3 ubiquitin-protein ligase smurf2 [Dermatophagoides pteronyssinus]
MKSKNKSSICQQQQHLLAKEKLNNNRNNKMATQTIALSTSSSQTKITNPSHRNHSIAVPVPSQTNQQRNDNSSSSNSSTASTSPITSTTGSPLTHPSSSNKQQQQQQNSLVNDNMVPNMVIDSPIHHQHSNSSCSNGHQTNRLNHHRRSHSQIIIASTNSQSLNNGSTTEISKIRLNGLPDPFCKITVDSCPSNAITGNQCHTTDICKDTLSPKWNKNYDLYLTKNDSLTISIWNQKKIHKKHGAGFLGCVKIMPNLIQSLKDAGYQRLDLHKFREEDPDIIKGQLVISMISRDTATTSKTTVINNNNSSRNNNVTIANGSNHHHSHRNSAILQNMVVTTASPTTNTTTASDNRIDDNSTNQDGITRSRNYVEGVDDLPDGWTECRTSNGRLYYMNHVLRTTQWERPILPAALTVSNSQTPSRPASSRSISRHHHQHLHQHHNHQPQSSLESTNSVSSANSVPTSQSTGPQQQQQRNNHQRRSTRHRNYLARNQLHEAVMTALNAANNNNDNCFNSDSEIAISSNNDNNNRTQSLPPMPVGYEMRTTPQGQVYFYQIDSGNSTWTDPRVPRELINMDINLDELVGPLGCGWEVRHTSGGRRYYVDHRNRTTQFTDPRLVSHSRMIINLIKSLSKSSQTLNNHSQQPQSNDSSNIHPSNHDNSNSSSKIKRTAITTAGDNLQNLKNGISSLPVNQQQKRRNLVQKMSLLRQELQAFQPQSGHCRIEVSRDDIFEDSYRFILKLRPKDLRKRLMIKFKDEEGLDYGGIAREWLYLLSHEMLNPYYGLFQYTRDDIYTLQINPDSSINPDHLSYFHFVGRVMGIAVFHGHYIDGGFTLPFYKMLLNKPITLDDIESVDPELYRSLRWMLENDITSVVDMTFSVNHDSFGQIQVKELKPNGKNIIVTEKNKKEYVQLYVNFRFTHGIEQQFRALQKGFCELVPQHLLGNFDEKELELVIGGLGKIDLADWKQHTRLKHCSPESNIVQWFWQAVDLFSEERRARLLQFVTGSSRVPLQGFKALQGSTGAAAPRLFTIHLIDADTENLPKAHTCFNRIDIPPYENYEKLFEKLTQAIEETCGFAVE